MAEILSTQLEAVGDETGRQPHADGSSMRPHAVATVLLLLLPAQHGADKVAGDSKQGDLRQTWLVEWLGAVCMASCWDDSSVAMMIDVWSSAGDRLFRNIKLSLIFPVAELLVFVCWGVTET